MIIALFVITELAATYAIAMYGINLVREDNK